MTDAFQVNSRVKCIKMHISLALPVNVGDEGTVLKIDPYGMLDTLEVQWDKFTYKSVVSNVCVVCLETIEKEAEEPYTIGGPKNIFEQLNIYDKETQERLWEATFGSKYRVKGE